jgi:hypothetical protein
MYPRVVSEPLRWGLLNPRLQWWRKPNIAHLLLILGIVLHRRRIRLRLAFTRGTLFLCPRMLLDRVVPMFRPLTGHAGIATRLVTRLANVPILPSRLHRETSIRGVFTIPLLRKFLLEK